MTDTAQPIDLTRKRPPAPAGAAAAQTLKARAVRAGLSVAVMTPTTPGVDWCDVWAKRGAVTVEGAAA